MMSVLKIGVILLYLSSMTLAQKRILGGSNAPEGKYPYMVSIRHLNGDQHFCGGTILNKRWILTAAHCVELMDWLPAYIIAGTNLLEGGAEQHYQIDSKIMADCYSNSFCDIGLIRVNRDIEFNKKIQPVKLPPENFSRNNVNATVIGWGVTNINHRHLPNELQELNVKTISQEECREKIGPFISDSHTCTLAKVGEGNCLGDSGGPLLVNDIQIGVTFGYLCGVGIPDVYTRVFTFVDWIKKHIEL